MSKRFLLLVSFLTACFSAQSATVTWTGSGDGTTWSDALNWTGGSGAPAAGDDVIINMNVAAGISLTANTAIINSLSVNSGVSNPLSFSGSSILFANNGVFSIASGAGQVTLATVLTLPNAANSSATITNNSSNVVLLNASGLFGGTATPANRTWRLAGGGGFVKNNGNNRLAGGSNSGASNIDVATGTVLNLSGGTNDDALGDGSGSPIGGISGGGIVTNTSGGTAKNVQLRWQNSNFSGSMQGNTQLLVQGNTHEFSGSNTYSGITTVSSGTLASGTLIINGTHVGGGNYTVAGNATGTGVLAGNGSVVLVNNTRDFRATGLNGTNRAIVYPGATNLDTADLDLGTDGASSVLTSMLFDDFSTLRLDIGALGNSDKLDVFGNLGLNGTDGLGATDVRLELMGLGATHGSTNFDGSSFTLATWTGTLAGAFDSIWVRDTASGALVDVTSAITGSGYVVGSNTYLLGYGANALTLSAIPEPSASVLLLTALGLFTLVVRRHPTSKTHRG